MVNEFRIGYVRGVYGESVDEIDPSQFGVSNTFLNTLPSIDIVGNLNRYGGFSASVLSTVQNTYQIADNFSWVSGRTAGSSGSSWITTVSRMESWGTARTALVTFNGLYTKANDATQTTANRINSVADYLLGIAQQSTLSIPSIANLRNTPWALYVQDDWKAARRLTVNLGLRYELHQPYREQLLGGARVDYTNGGRLVVADPEIARLSNLPYVVCCSPERVVDTDKNDFGPRIGIAWQPFSANNMVVRAGYGVYYADSTQFFHWRAYEPLPKTVYTTQLGDFVNPGASLNNLFPDSAFSPGGKYTATFGPVPPGGRSTTSHLSEAAIREHSIRTRHHIPSNGV